MIHIHCSVPEVLAFLNGRTITGVEIVNHSVNGLQFNSFYEWTPKFSNIMSKHGRAAVYISSRLCGYLARRAAIFHN